IIEIETELKKRLKYPYKWGQKQNDNDDKKTNFIYHTFYFNQLIEKIKNEFKNESDYKQLANYALNRWYNFWSAMAVEKIFCSLPNVKPALNKYNKLVDFTINGIQFDHKTTVFPKGYNNSFEYAKNNPTKIIRWLYANQSQEQRKHFRNRLFIILYNSTGEHWKLKAEISIMKDQILNYVKNFNKNSLINFHHKDGYDIYSDVIWIRQL
ncbi:MAG: hypothetical protein U9N76_02880, partial [Candidatus Marinimicrobia bacterium]|nr:hypothetical protein [Candidatus Neomarinimicrobiota bacterium]